MRYFLLVAIIAPLLAQAGIPADIEPEQASEMGVEVVLWHDFKSHEIEPYKEHVLCTPVTVFFPLKDAEHPTYTRVTSSGIITFNGKHLAYPDMYVTKTDDGKRNYATACVPLGEGYEVDIQYSYNPVDEKTSLMCPPSFQLVNIERYIAKPVKE